MRFAELDFDEIQDGLAKEEILIVDVREPHEFAAGHIPGSISLPLSRFHPDDLPDSGGKRLVLSCAAGIRSLQALHFAARMGHAVEAHYRGGFKDWLQSGGAIATGDASA